MAYPLKVWNGTSWVQVSTASTDLTTYATNADPTFTGTVTIPTASISAITSSAGYIGEVLTSRSITTQIGGASANLVGNASITLTPGTWLVQATGNIVMNTGSTNDGVSCGIWNSTGSVEVASSRGSGSYATPTTNVGVVSMQTVITVISNTAYSPYLCRNGSSTVATTASALSAANSITALRIR